MKLELCVTDPKGLQIAKKYRFDRVELCVNLEMGGLTPSPGLVHMALNLGLETHALIRPRAGGFVYSDAEKELILAEIHALKYLGVHGFVVGALKENKEIDTTLIGEIAKITKGKELTFHRAFDEMAEWEDGVGVLKFFQFKRVLTSGRAANVDEGMKNYTEIKDLFGNDLELMIGGGVNAKNAKELVEDFQPSALHFSGANVIQDKKSMFGGNRMEIDEKKVYSILSSLRD
jgi:copper homeostasis protein|tara:strand:+ start:30479 stop:31174 length:696 start_codon:yes stop_codon:yes gene_type:complete